MPDPQQNAPSEPQNLRSDAVPIRVQLRRTKGYRRPEGAIVVARPSKWGNPFPVVGVWIMWTAIGLGYMAHAEGRRAAAVALHRTWLTGEPLVLGPHAEEKFGGVLVFDDGTELTLTEHAHGIALTAARLVGDVPELPERPSVAELRGHDLACWCPLDRPCHADVLLEVANA